MSALPNTPDPDRLLSPEEAAELLQVSAPMVRRWAVEEVIPAIRLSGYHRWRFRRCSLLAWLGHEEPAPDAEQEEAVLVVAKTRRTAVRQVSPRDYWRPDDRAYAAILDRDPCSYCGAPMQGLDHIEARITGGEHIWTNLTAACRRCNSGKGKKPVLLFLLARRSA